LLVGQFLLGEWKFRIPNWGKYRQEQTTMYENMGIDLSVLAHPEAHDASEVDCLVARRPNRAKGAAPYAELTDLQTCSERTNLAQALFLRLLTPSGSLTSLGHARYGSRLHELIGRPKNSSTRNLCRLFVLQAIAQEARVEPKAVSFAFDQTAERIDNFVFICEVQPLVGGDPLALSLEVTL
jgi:phage baseplate assembly protein W